MIKFEKVSFNQFKEDCMKCGIIMTEQAYVDCYNNIQLPTRSSAYSAGYDIHTPVSFRLWERVPVVQIPLGIRVLLEPNQFLMIVPRSGLGFKTGMKLANTVGIIDADYAHSKNEGHIMAKLVLSFNDAVCEAGDRILQGIIVPFCTTDDDDAKGVRDGGFGSTGK